MIGSYLVDVLARELRDELLKTLILGLNADGAEDSLDILSRGGGVAAEGEQEVSCEVLHFESFCRREKIVRNLQILFPRRQVCGSSRQLCKLDRRDSNIQLRGRFQLRSCEERGNLL